MGFMLGIGWFWLMMFLLWIGLISGVAVLVFVFWILILIDCCRRKFNKGFERLIWLLVIIFSHAIGAFIYYVVIKKNNTEGLLNKDGSLK